MTTHPDPASPHRSAGRKGTAGPTVRPGLGALGLPAAELSDVLSGSLPADAVIVGMPFDAGVASVPGQRHGPEIFRKLSATHEWTVDADGKLGGLIDPVTRTSVLDGRSVFDVGDLGSVPIDPRMDRGAYYRAAASLAESLAKLPTVPVFIGGDHSVSAPIALGTATAYGPLDLVCFDAHCDYHSRAMPAMTDITHADFLGHLLQLGAVSAVDVYGVRALLPASCGPLPRSLRCAYRYPFPEPAGDQRNRPTHLSIDLDVLEPADFPATGHPEAGGYRLRELTAAVEHVCRSRRVVVVDIVEALPDERENRATSAIVSALVMTCLRAVLERDLHRTRSG